MNVTLQLLALAALQFLIALWLKQRLTAALERENAQFLEKLRWDLKIREQAARVAEYMALVTHLPSNRETTIDRADYNAANRLSWELAMWLPSNIYRSMTKAIAAPDRETNIHSVVIDVRKILLQERAEDLHMDDIAVHAPGIGKQFPVKPST